MFLLLLIVSNNEMDVCNKILDDIEYKLCYTFFYLTRLFYSLSISLF